MLHVFIWYVVTVIPAFADIHSLTYRKHITVLFFQKMISENTLSTWVCSRESWADLSDAGWQSLSAQMCSDSGRKNLQELRELINPYFDPDFIKVNAGRWMPDACVRHFDMNGDTEEQGCGGNVGEIYHKWEPPLKRNLKIEIHYSSILKNPKLLTKQAMLSGDLCCNIVHWSK